MLIIVWILAQIAGPAAPVSTIERDCRRQLLTVRRVYVDRLNGGETVSASPPRITIPPRLSWVSPSLMALST